MDAVEWYDSRTEKELNQLEGVKDMLKQALRAVESIEEEEKRTEGEANSDIGEAIKDDKQVEVQMKKLLGIVRNVEDALGNITEEMDEEIKEAANELNY